MRKEQSSTLVDVFFHKGDPSIALTVLCTVIHKNRYVDNIEIFVINSCGVSLNG